MSTSLEETRRLSSLTCTSSSSSPFDMDHDDDDDDHHQDDATVASLASPPRRCTSVATSSSTTATTTATRPSSGLLSIMSARRTNTGATTGGIFKNRRLFDDDDDDDDDDTRSCESMSIMDMSSPPPSSAAAAAHAAGLPPRRSTLKPVDLNHVVNLNNSENDMEGEPFSCRKKRSSAERRAVGRASTGSTDAGAAATAANNDAYDDMARPRTPTHCLMDEDSNSMMIYTSPHISPNSYLTMDGRFVHSKNPFSSPMMMDNHGGITTGGDDAAAAAAAGRVKAAPSLPESFSYDEDVDGSTSSTSASSLHYSCSTSIHRRGFLPPRNSKLGSAKRAGPINNNATTTPYPASASPRGGGGGGSSSNSPHPHYQLEQQLNTGYPDKRFSFTGSPIPEQPTHHHQHSHHHHNNDNNIAMMETDAATCGSLHKVRRLNRDDDVFSASGHHLNSLRRAAAEAATTTDQHQHYQHHSSLTVDTTINNPHGAAAAAAAAGSQDEDLISPTEVANFPPPTPVKKAKPSQQSGYQKYPQRQAPPQGENHHHLYSSLHYAAAAAATGRSPPQPPTPVAERRRQKAAAARTPHPGSMMHHHSHDEEDDDDDAEFNHHFHHHDHHSSTGGQKPQLKSRFYSDFDVIGELGKGTFGTVFKVLSRLDGCMYAIKAAQRQAKGEADRDRMLKEVYALATLSDQANTAAFHIVRYHQAWMEDDRLYIQTELCQGNLADEMKRQPLVLLRRYKLLREISLALAFLHGNNMVHLDIKPDNIFIKNDQFKLGDFGLVTKAVPRASSHHHQHQNDDVEEGDSRYMSMELLAGDHSDLTKSDIFSLGATMYEICIGRPLPMNGPEWQELRNGGAGRLLHQQLGASCALQERHGSGGADMQDLISLVQSMMEPNHATRPGAADLLKHRQLLSDEQKALWAERTKVVAATLELEKRRYQQHHLQNATTAAAPLSFGMQQQPQQVQMMQQQHYPLMSCMPPRRGLQRANTWNGQTGGMPSMLMMPAQTNTFNHHHANNNQNAMGGAAGNE